METQLLQNASAFQKYYIDGSARLLHSAGSDGASERDLNDLASLEHQAAIRPSSILVKPEFGNFQLTALLRVNVSPPIHPLILSSLF